MSQSSIYFYFALYNRNVNKFLYSFMSSLLRQLLFLLLLFLSSLSNSASIKIIDINGLNNLTRGNILGYIPFEIGDQIQPDILEKTTSSLKRTNLFKEVNVSLENEKLSIELVENPTIKYVDFLDYEDKDIFSEKFIENVQKNFDIYPGKVFKSSNLDALIKNLNSLLISNGYYNSNINKKLITDDKNRLGIELVINENDKALIKSFKITGNNFFDSDTLKDSFEIGDPDFFLINFFTEKDRFNQRSFDAGIETITNKYLNAGFLDFKVNSSNINLSSNKENINIEVDINEGIQYSIKEIKFKGESLGISQTLLRSQFDMKDGEVIDRTEVVNGVKKIGDLFADRGYAYSNITSSSILTKEPGQLIVVINLDPGNLIYLNRIIISGNTRTQDSVIRRELKINESETYSKKSIDNSINRIKRLGYFEKVKHNLIPVKGVKDKMNLIIQVTESKTGEFTIGLSHSNATGPSFNLGIKERNILGTGNTFNAALVSSKAVSQASFYFSDPYFNEKNYSINYGFYSKSLDASNLDVSNYQLDTDGASIGLGIPIAENQKISTDISLSDNSLTCGSLLASSGYELSQCSSKDSLDVSYSIGYVANSTNDYYFPTSGSITSLKGTLALPFGDYKYYQLESSFNNYSKVSESLTFGFKSKLNLASGYGNKDLPFFKRYYGGGSSSVRGFDFNSLGTKYPNGDPKGGELSFISSASVISPVDVVNIDNDNIRLSGFFDLGSINDKASNFSIDELRASSGIALSWLTPIGPISMFAAKPLVSKSTDKTESFSFELGAKF